MFRKDSFVALYFLHFSSIISLHLCLFPSAVLFILTIWAFGLPPPWSLLLWKATQGALTRLERWSEHWLFFSIQANVRPSSSQWIRTKLTSAQPLIIQLPLQPPLGSPSTALFHFFKHVSSLKAKFFPRLKVLRCISACSWSFSLSCIKFSSAPPYLCFIGWFPFLSGSNVIKLKRLHRAASRAITGRLSSLIPFLLSEVFLSPLRVTLTHFSRPSHELASLSSNLLSHFRFGRFYGSTHAFSLHAHSLLLETCLPSLCSPLFPPYAPSLIFLSLAKVRVSLILTFSHLVI